VAGGTLSGLLGLGFVLVTAVRRRRAARARAAVAVPPAPGGPVPVAVQPAPGGQVSWWYLATIPLVAVAVLSCGAGVVLGARGFENSLDVPDAGPPQSSGVAYVFGDDVDYWLYADVAGNKPAEPSACQIVEVGENKVPQPLTLHTRRPLGAPETVTLGPRTFRFMAAFRPGGQIYGAVSCQDKPTLLVRPSNRPQLVAAAGVGTATLALLAAVAVVAAVAAGRRRSRRRTASAPMP